MRQRRSTQQIRGPVVRPRSNRRHFDARRIFSRESAVFLQRTVRGNDNYTRFGCRIGYLADSKVSTTERAAVTARGGQKATSPPVENALSLASNLPAARFPVDHIQTFRRCVRFRECPSVFPHVSPRCRGRRLLLSSPYASPRTIAQHPAAPSSPRHNREGKQAWQSAATSIPMAFQAIIGDLMCINFFNEI